MMEEVRVPARSAPLSIDFEHLHVTGFDSRADSFHRGRLRFLDIQLQLQILDFLVGFKGSYSNILRSSLLLHHFYPLILLFDLSFIPIIS